MTLLNKLIKNIMDSKKIKVKEIRKRDGRVVKFEKKKLINAIHKAFIATEEGSKRNAIDLAKKVECEIYKRFSVRNGGGMIKVEAPTVEEVQDIVESFLIRENYIDSAKSYKRKSRCVEKVSRFS